MTTHSVEDSGLLEALTSAFHTAHPDLRLVTTAVGSGAALEIGRRGDGDVLLTHDPEGERDFTAAGHGSEQAPVMANEFVVAGPPQDPARVAGLTDAVDAFRAIAGSSARFLSRGDDSGTHRKERFLWQAAGLEPWVNRPGWYVEAGLGMAETLQIADQMNAYVLTDEATLLRLRRRLRIEPLVRSDPRLDNLYVYTLPVGQRNPMGARAFVDWLLSEGQAVISEFSPTDGGSIPFRPLAQDRPEAGG